MHEVPSKMLRKRLLTIMVDDFWEAKERELNANIYDITTTKTQVTQYIKTLRKRWEDVELFWKDYALYWEGRGYSNG